MNKGHIAVIVEGTRREPQIWNQIQPLLTRNKIDAICLPAGKNIYHIWKRLKDDNFRTDVIEIVREISPEAAESLGDLTRTSFSRVYLFFDLDPQQKNLPKSENPMEIVSAMLRTFSEETDHGKLYVSYPMAEAVRDFKENDCGAFWQCAVPADLLKDYKRLSGVKNPMADMRNYQRQTWEMLIAIFLRRCACLLQWTDGQTLPETGQLYQWYRNNDLNPAEIFRAEMVLLEKKERIFVLSAFPEFLLDYFKPAYWDNLPQNLRDISHGQCVGLESALASDDT